MQNAISIFNFNQSQVRIQFHNGEPYFCLADVAKIMEIKNPRQLKLNSKGVCKAYTPTESGNQEMTFINEPNLYRVIFRSNKPEAVKFQDWIFEEVIPQIRQTGAYSGNPKPTKDERTGLRQAVTMLVGKADINHSAAYKLVHHRFGVAHIDELTHSQIPQAIEYVHRLILDGEVLDKTQATPFNQTEFACHFVKLLNYARCYLRFQKLLCNDPNSPKAQELLNFFQYSVNVNQTGFLFVFKPDVENDIQKAVDFIHHHFQQHDLQMI